MSTSTSPKFFYGWVIVAICSVTLFVVFGIRLSFTVFFVALTNEFSWARADTSLIFSITMVVFTIVSPIAGILLDKYGVRLVFGVGATLTTIGLLLSSQITSFSQLVISYGVIAGSGVAILGLGLQAAVIARWFRRRRGLAIGIAFAGTGLGSLVIIPTVSHIVITIGWRGAYLTLAALMATLILPIVLWLRLNPQSKGQAADDGRREPPAPVVTAAGSPSSTPTATTTISQQPTAVWHALPFWLLLIAGMGAIGPLRLLSVHQLAILQGAGVSLTAGSRIVGAAGAITAAAFILFGALSDKIGRRLTYILGSLCLLSAYVLITSITTPEQTGRLWLYALCLGLGEGSRSSLVSAVASDLFPSHTLGTVNGAVGASFGIGAAFFPWLAGRWFDLTGSYTQAFWVAAAAVLISAVALWIASGAAKTP